MGLSTTKSDSGSLAGASFCCGHLHLSCDVFVRVHVRMLATFHTCLALPINTWGDLTVSMRSRVSFCAADTGNEVKPQLARVHTYVFEGGRVRMRARVHVRRLELACMRALCERVRRRARACACTFCVRACARARACVFAWVRACVHACVRECVRGRGS